MILSSLTTGTMDSRLGLPSRKSSRTSLKRSWTTKAVSVTGDSNNNNNNNDNRLGNHG